MKFFFLLILAFTITTVLVACSEKTVTPDVIVVEGNSENHNGNSTDSVIVDSNECVLEKKGDTIFYICNGDVHEWFERVSCDSLRYDTKMEFCYDGGVYQKCDGKTYQVDKFFCDRDSILPLCGGRKFGRDSLFCHNEQVFLLKDGKEYNADSVFWDGDSLRLLCGGKQYDPLKNFCHKDVVFEKYHGSTYNADSVFCYKDSLFELCGGVPYNPDSSLCSREIVFERYHGETYDTDKFFCYKDSLFDLCGNLPYDLTAEFCQDGEVQSLCDGNPYRQDYYCYKGSFYKRCGGNSYDQQTEFCQYGQVFPKCDGKIYKTNINFCDGGKLYDKCGDLEYDPSEKQCFEGKLYDYFTDERDGQTYRYAEIGNYTWMTQNLNYAYKEPTSTLDSSSFCYNGVVGACKENGRLYLWSAAVDSAAIFSSEGKGCGDGVKCFAVENPVRVRGVCPEGWYLPHFDEAYNIYQNLMMNVISRNIFSIEYVGFYSSEDDAFWGGGAVFSIWFSAEDEDEMPYSYVYSKELGKEEYGLKIDSKSSAHSVRCVKDE